MDAAGVKLFVALILGVVVKKAASGYNSCEEIRNCQLAFGREADGNVIRVLCHAYRTYFKCVKEASNVCKSAADPRFLTRLDKSRSTCSRQCPAAVDCEIKIDGTSDENQGGLSGENQGFMGSGLRGDNSKGNTANGEISRGDNSEDEPNIEKAELDTEEEFVDDFKVTGDHTDFMSTSNTTEVPSPEPEGGNKGMTSRSTIPLLTIAIFLVLCLL